MRLRTHLLLALVLGILAGLVCWLAVSRTVVASATMGVQSSAWRIAARERERVAIATLYTSAGGGATAGYDCAMVLWCQGATSLARTIRTVGHRVDIRIISRNTTAPVDCAHAVPLWGAEFDALVAAAVSAHGAVTDHWFRRGRAHLGEQLLKFGLFARTEYDLLIFLDVDTHPNPDHSALRPDEWSAFVSAFTTSPYIVSASPDHSTPVNSGAFVAKTSKWVYADALAAVRYSTFNATHGWGHASRPRSVETDLHSLALGAAWDTTPGLRLPCCMNAGFASLTNAQRTGVTRAALELERTEMWEKDSYKFVSGDSDQGLLWSLLYIANHVGTWPHEVDAAGWQRCWSGQANARWANLNCTGRQWRVSHWWGPRKPWRGELTNPSTSFYFAQIRGLPSSKTPCLRRLSEMRARLIDAGRWGEDDTASNAPFDQAVLASPAIANGTIRDALSDCGGRRARAPPARRRC